MANLALTMLPFVVTFAVAAWMSPPATSSPAPLCAAATQPPAPPPATANRTAGAATSPSPPPHPYLRRYPRSLLYNHQQ